MVASPDAIIVYAPFSIGTDWVDQLNSSPKKPCDFGRSLEEYSNHTKRPVGILFVMPVGRTGRARIDKLRKRSGSQRDRLTLGNEVEGYRVQAVALPGRPGAVVEHVAEVGITTRATNLDPAHPMTDVGELSDVGRIVRLEERRPAGVRL